MIQSIKALQEYLAQNNMRKTLQSFRAQLLKQIPNQPSQQFYQLFHQQSLIEKQNTNYNYHNNNSLNTNNNNYINKISQKQTQLLTNIQKKRVQKKRHSTSHLPVQGLLGKIAYSQKLLQNNEMSEKINHLMDNKIFLKQLTKLFPETKHQLLSQQHNQLSTFRQQQQQQGNNQQQYHDQLDMIVQHNNKNNISSQHHQESLQSFSINNNQISSIDFNHNNQEEDSIISQHNKILDQFEHVDQQEEYADDRDYGYQQHIFDQESLMAGCQELSKIYHYPLSAILKENKKDNSYLKFKQSIQLAQKLKFPKRMIFPSDQDPIYPLQFNGISYDIMSLKIIYDRQKIGYEEEKQFELKKGDIIAGRYQVQKILGNGVFAKVIKAKDLASQNQSLTCFKMIQNDKDFLDQALDQLKLLRYIKANCDPNQHYLLNFKQVFYHRQHLFIQTDLLKDNLLTAFQNNPSFFSVQVIKKISIQLLEALATLHQMNIIHADLKPQNIMVKTYNPIQVRVIDLGNGSFTHDHNLSNYVQSRSYRAPQVVLGCGYNEKIDIWSLGCILAQLWTKNVLFFNHHIQGMIARIQSIIGPWPQWMLQNGENVVNLFSNQNFIYHHDKEKQLYHIFIPKKTSLKNRIRCDDQLFVDFIRSLVEIDPLKRVSALQAMQHPFLKQ